MSRIIFSVLILISFFKTSFTKEYLFNVTEFGALGDDQSNATGAIQQAIQTCHAAGGGTVMVPSGTYRCGPLKLLSNVNLHLQPGALIKGSTNLNEYTVEETSESGESTRAGVITARNATNVSLTGYGIVDGSALAFVDSNRIHYGVHPDYDKKFTRQGEDYLSPKFGTQHGPLAHEERPGNLIRFIDCQNVRIQGVTIQNSPTWTVQIHQCEQVDINNVNINSFASDRRVPNDDGIDLRNSRFIHISDCDIQTGDDAIAVFGSEQLTVTNCTLSARSSGIRVGYVGRDIKDCTFSNLVIHNSNRGLGVFVRGAGSVENVLFSDIIIHTRLYTGHWWGNGEPIHVSVIPFEADVTQPGKIKNIRFRNIVAEAEHGIVIYGCADSQIENLLFDNVQLKIKNSPLNAAYGGNFDLRSAKNMNEAIFKHDIPSLYARYVRHLEIHHFRLMWEEGLPEFFQDGIYCEHFEDVLIEDFRGRQPHLTGKGAALSLTTGAGLTVRNCRADVGTTIFLRHGDVKDRRLFVNNDVFNARQVFEPSVHTFQATGNLMPRK